MLTVELKNKSKKIINILWLIILPLAWYVGTAAIRKNIDFLCQGMETVLSNSNISDYVVEMTKKQYYAQNGFMVFIEGCSDFYLPLAIVLLSGTAFSDSFAYDKSTGFGNFVLTRTTFKKYYTRKIASVSIMSFALSFITLLAVLLVSILVYSAKTPTEDFNFSLSPDNALSKLFFSHYWLACILLIFTLSLFGSAYTLLGMGIGLFTSNRFIISISPLGIYILCTLIPQLFNTNSPIAKYIAWIFPQYLTGMFTNNSFWYTELPFLFVYCIHFFIIVIPAFLMLYFLYQTNKKQYIN